MNCGRKGHAASECREGRKERPDHPCFTCGKPGHEAKNCPNKGSAPRRADVKAIENGPARIAAVMCVTEKVVDGDGFTMVAKGPRPQQPHLGDFIRSSTGRAPARGSNRFRPLSLSDWQEIAEGVCDGSHKGQVVEVVLSAPPPAPSSRLDFPDLQMCIICVILKRQLSHQSTFATIHTHHLFQS